MLRNSGCERSAVTFIHELFMSTASFAAKRQQQRRHPSALVLPLFGRTLMASKITLAAAIALAAIVAVPSASFATSKARNSHRDVTNSYRDVTKCEGGACTAVNPDRDFINTSRNAQFYRSTHKKHKSRPKN